MRAAVQLTLLMGCAAGLGWIDWRLWNLSVNLPLPIAAGQVEDAALPSGALPAASQPDFASFSVIWERPLFVAGRSYKTLAESALPQVSTEGNVPKFQLTGVMLQKGKARALLAAAGQPHGWIAEGETITGWEIVRVTAGTVTMKSGDDEVVVELYRATPAAGSGQQ